MPTTETNFSSAENTTLPDETVIELIRAGNTTAYEIIMRRYNQRLYRISRSILSDNDAAQDAVQQAYISAYYKLDSYTHTGSIGAWLSKITVNEALMIKRKPDNRMVDSIETLENDSFAQTLNNPATTHANKELATLIETAVEKLPDDFRYVFVLRAIQQLSTRETADSLGINEATVKTRYHRARNLMQSTLNQHIEQTGMHVYEFAGQRCDHIVNSVLKHLDVLSD